MLSSRHRLATALLTLAASLGALASSVEARPFTSIVPERLLVEGTYDAAALGDIEAKYVTFANGATVVCAPGTTLSVTAEKIEWNGTVTFQCDGPKGQRGFDGWQAAELGWCVDEERSDEQTAYRDAVLWPGGRGGDGGDGWDGSDVHITAQLHWFRPGARVVISSKGGAGGEPGAPGKGQTKALAPSHDDCANGTNFKKTAKAPDGAPGSPGQSGTDGWVTFRSGFFFGLPLLDVKAGQLTADVAQVNIDLQQMAKLPRLERAARVLAFERPQPSNTQKRRIEFPAEKWGVSAETRRRQGFLAEIASQAAGGSVWVTSASAGRGAGYHAKGQAIDFVGPESAQAMIAAGREASRLLDKLGEVLVEIVDRTARPGSKTGYVCVIRFRAGKLVGSPMVGARIDDDLSKSTSTSLFHAKKSNIHLAMFDGAEVPKDAPVFSLDSNHSASAKPIAPSAPLPSLPPSQAVSCPETDGAFLGAAGGSHEGPSRSQAPEKPAPLDKPAPPDKPTKEPADQGGEHGGESFPRYPDDAPVPETGLY